MQQPLMKSEWTGLGRDDHSGGVEGYREGARVWDMVTVLAFELMGCRCHTCSLSSESLASGLRMRICTSGATWGTLKACLAGWFDIQLTANEHRFSHLVLS